MIDKFLKEHTPPVKEFLENFLAAKSKQMAHVNRWGEDYCRRLLSFSNSGKMLRAGLVLLAHRMYGGNSENDAVKVAASLELIHSSILIHDDIMDRDIYRRGEESMHQQYCSLGINEKIDEPEHFGSSMGICAGDIGFFLACDILSGLSSAAFIQNRIIQTCAGELANVGLAQMQDMYLCYNPMDCNEEDILRLYEYKTARYTFSLPLIAGSMLCDVPEDQLQKIAELGTWMGILFQIKDDELDIFGSEKSLGKPIGSDIKQGKKTLHLFYLYKKILPGEQKRRGDLIPASMDDNSISHIRKLIEEYGIHDEIMRKMDGYKGQAQEIIGSLDIDPHFKELFHHLLHFLIHRNR